jgi:hypothetical protein
VRRNACVAKPRANPLHPSLLKNFYDKPELFRRPCHTTATLCLYASLAGQSNDANQKKPWNFRAAPATQQPHPLRMQISITGTPMRTEKDSTLSFFRATPACCSLRHELSASCK